MKSEVALMAGRRRWRGILPRWAFRCSGTTGEGWAKARVSIAASRAVPTTLPQPSRRFVPKHRSVKRLVAFGNCDAATSLGLFHHALGIDALLLANPWCR